MTEGRPEHVHPSAHAAAATRQELAALAARAAQGDSAALTLLQRRLHAGLTRWFARTWPGDPERVERLAHETWIEVWQSLANGRYDARRAAISTFAFAVAGNLRLRELRSIGRTLAPSDEAEPTLEVHDAAMALAHASTLEAVRHLICDRDSPLDESDRTTLALLARGMGDRDIARELGVSPSTGHERKKRALAKLANELRALGHSVHDNDTAPISGSLIQGKLA